MAMALLALLLLVEAASKGNKEFKKAGDMCEQRFLDYSTFAIIYSIRHSVGRKNSAYSISSPPVSLL